MVTEASGTTSKPYHPESFSFSSFPSLAKSSWKVKASCFSNKISPPVVITFFKEGIISVDRNSGVFALFKRRFVSYVFRAIVLCHSVIGNGMLFNVTGSGLPFDAPDWLTQ